MKGVEIKCSFVKHTLALLVTVGCERKSTVTLYTHWHSTHRLQISI